MPVFRENCVVLDTSILPKRPCISVIKTFMDNELQLDMSLVTSIQPHNVKNVVYLGMRDKQAADRIASDHHLKHCLECEGEKFPLPIYVESSAVDVRIHDLPLDMDNLVIVNHMRQYGEVIAIRNEVWKSHFPGYVNGVRVLRMKLSHPIPSYITVDDEVTLVSYKNQVKTCRNCDRKSHPKLRCSEVAAAATVPPVAAGAKKHNTQSEWKKNNSNGEQNLTNNRNSDKSNNNNNSNKKTIDNKQHTDATNYNQWPSLPNPTTDADNSKRTAMNKRQRSIDSITSKNDTKKVNTNDPTTSDSDCSLTTVSDICPFTQRPYNIPTFEWIENEDQKRALIEDCKRQIDALYLAQHEGN